MNDPQWTRAVVLREPRRRVLSAYLDKYVLHGSYGDRVRADKRYVSFHEFVESTQVDTGMRLARRRTGAHPLSTVDPHHRPQALFMDKFLPYMNFIAEYTQVQHHVHEMLEKVGMWEQYGASGWGRDKQQAIYQPNSNTVQRHSTNSEALHELFYTPEIEQMVMRSYAIDYDMFRDLWDPHLIVP
eukprot:TRINITY_DN1787_c5_g1_i1.p2 TRINITY_DN1787_c5_g1~~TRINITY_DN1787_c5_g1_i1.p2  ORF type:complete len:185 (+),score=67.38 TRINITY_DN1787_c5_g1_i1:308-862(+)